MKIKTIIYLKQRYLEKNRKSIGIAAGFDKNAEVYNSLFRLGFGFVEGRDYYTFKTIWQSKTKSI